MSDDLRFDQLLREDASALPPAMAVVDPWREAMTLVLWGMGLTTITLNFLYLDMILPALGGILMVLGFRTLRQENGALQWCWRLSIAAAAARGVSFVLAALPLETGNVPAILITLLLLALYFCLWRGMVGVSRAAGAEKPAAPAAGALVIFYAVMCALAFMELRGWLAVLPVLIVYIVILRNLVKLSQSLADTGYAIHAAPVRLPAAAVLWGYLGLTLAAVVLAMLLGQRYPMDWQARDDAAQDETIRAELLDLGFPEKVLDDLTAEEVARMSGAVKVYVEEDPLYEKEVYREITTAQWTDDPPPRWEYSRAEKQPDGSYRYTWRVYDSYETAMTHIAVELPERYGEKQYYMLHYLEYVTLPKARYTESLDIWPIWQVETGWRPGGFCGGRLLCDKSGQSYTADLLSLESGAREVTDSFGTRSQYDIMAQWSRLAGGQNVRLYVMYDALRQENGSVLTDHVNYLRQDAPLYPATRSADALWQSRNSDAVEWYQTAFQIWLYQLEE